MRDSDGWTIATALNWAVFVALTALTFGVLNWSWDRLALVGAWEGLAALIFLSRITPRNHR
jgi:hypothetical protein